jgi:c-di-AMP phosphodiesterase-like protein
MSSSDQLNQLKKALTDASAVLVLIGQNPNHDFVAAGLGLYLVLKEAGKETEIACPSDMRVEFSHLVGLDKIKNKLGNKNLVVSFDYVEDSIEKVSYHVKENKFNLVVQPKPGAKPLDSDKVTYSYTGARADLIFVIGARSFDGLGSFYGDEKQIFSESYTVSVGNSNVTPFSKTTIVDVNASSVSEVAYSLLSSLEFKVEGDAASNFLSGIDYATGRFGDSRTPASSFAAAAQLIGKGATRSNREGLKEADNTARSNQDMATEVLRPMSMNASAATPPQNETSENDEDPPKDWFEPKIYKGATKV